ncbi:MAG: hypothetical protein MI922_14740, partial [Bacteroidales bacterium]|nr:hypothetical protein [Bacteroidales bacterium]
RKEFTIKNAEIIAENNTKDFACKPVFKTKEGKVVVLYQCPTKEPVKVSFKQDNTTFFSHDLNDSKLAAKYDVSSLPTGIYEISLTAGTKYFTYDLEVD